LKESPIISGQTRNPMNAIITANKGNLGHMVAGAALTECAFAI
jgi:hypothetical protein